jgi:two-component system, cell cycle response regulator
MDLKKIIFKYIIIVSVVFLVFLIGRVVYDYLHKKDMLNDRLSYLSNNLQTTFYNSKKQLIQKYSMIIQHYMNSQKIYQLFKNDKHQELHQLLEKDYNDFKSIDKHLFVMHFIDKDNITVLRMHKPHSTDDDLSLKRPMVAYVNRSLKTQAAFETGKNGIVYRVTTPYVFNKDHVGVLEFGIKLDYFMETLEKSYGVFGALMVKTDHLKVLVAQKEYPTLDDYSLISQDTAFHQIIDLIDSSKSQQIIEHENKVFLVCSLDLEDYQGNVVSKIFATKDITSITQQYNMWLYFINFSSILVYLLIIILMTTVLIKFAKEIQNNLFTIKKLNKKSEYLKNKANTDTLTKIYNKEYFNTELKQFLHDKRSGVLMFLDIDHFKHINDTYGHMSGDEILKNMTKKISSQLRDEDIFARWGGEEFTILLANTTLGNAYIKADQIRKDIEKTKLYEEIQITISIGLAEIQDDEPMELLLKRADDLLYKAKNGGRNCVMF